MAPAGTTAMPEDQPEFAEMKPVAIYHQPDMLQQVQLSNPDAQAQLQETLKTILELQQKIAMAQGTGATAGDSQPAMPEASATGEAFNPYGTSTGNDDEELVEDEDPSPIRRMRGETEHTKYINHEEADTSGDVIRLGASFTSFKEFNDAFVAWKDEGFHPMRIASSESLKDPSGVRDVKFKYKHAVYHCAHYGNPRFRGCGARPNQSYLPCKCPSMFRLNFNYMDQVLRITSMNIDHKGHPMTAQHYKDVCSSVRSGNNKRRSQALSPNTSGYTESPGSSYQGSPYSVKQEPVDEVIHHKQRVLEELKRQQQEVRDELGIESPSSSQTGSSRMISSHDYGIRMPEEECEPKPMKTRRMDETPKNSISRSGRQIRVPVRHQAYEENYEAMEEMQEFENVFIDVPALPGLPKMEQGASYKNWNDFERAFNHWKDTGLHPMRVASSETMKDLHGVLNPTYKYKYAVFHCAHYGIPRQRGSGQRPNQTYLPCGCRSMLRLGYNFDDQTLKVNSLVADHQGHSRDRKHYERVKNKIETSRGRSGTGSYVSSTVSTPVATQSFSQSPMIQSQPATPGMADAGFKELIALVTASNQATMQLLQQQQQAQSQSGGLNLAGILGAQLAGLSTLPGMDHQGIQQPQHAIIDTPAELDGLARPIAQHPDGMIVKEFNNDIKDL